VSVAQLVVTQVRSAIGAKPKQRGTLRALGLRRLGQSNTLPDRAEIRGMIARVPHLISVEVVNGDAAAVPNTPSSPNTPNESAEEGAVAEGEVS
jgi:large subunit ribosomal protein L30